MSDLWGSDWRSPKEPIRLGALLAITKTGTHKEIQRQKLALVFVMHRERTELVF